MHLVALVMASSCEHQGTGSCPVTKVCAELCNTWMVLSISLIASHKLLSTKCFSCVFLSLSSLQVQQRWGWWDRWLTNHLCLSVTTKHFQRWADHLCPIIAKKWVKNDWAECFQHHCHKGICWCSFWGGGVDWIVSLSAVHLLGWLGHKWRQVQMSPMHTQRGPTEFVFRRKTNDNVLNAMAVSHSWKWMVSG